MIGRCRNWFRRGLLGILPSAAMIAGCADNAHPVAEYVNLRNGGNVEFARAQAIRSGAGGDELWIFPTGPAAAAEEDDLSGGAMAVDPAVFPPPESGSVTRGQPGTFLHAAGSGGGGAGGAGGGATLGNAGRIPVPGSPILAAHMPAGEIAALPLLHTDVSATISGALASVEVKQQFANPFPRSVDAAYIFPLPPNSGVHDFVMTIGQRHIRGIIRERAQAEQIYDQARQQGLRASLMEQVRANVFMHRIADLEPAQPISIDIHYFHMLAFEGGWLEWDFPMTRGPQHAIPVASGSGPNQVGRSATDAAFLTRPATRNGRDISLQVKLDSATPINNLESDHHAIHQSRPGDGGTLVTLDQADTIPNSDFELRFKAGSSKIQAEFSAQPARDSDGGFFALWLIPPQVAVGASSGPLLSGIQIAFPAGATAVDILPEKLPNLFAGRPLLITGRYSGKISGDVAVTGDSATDRETYHVAAKSPAAENWTIASLWALSKMADLQNPARAGQNDTEQAKSLALSYGLVSPFTSMIAVDSLHPASDDRIDDEPMPKER